MEIWQKIKKKFRKLVFKIDYNNNSLYRHISLYYKRYPWQKWREIDKYFKYEDAVKDMEDIKDKHLCKLPEYYEFD